MDMSLQIEEAFTHHPPFGDQAKRYVEIRDHGKSLAHLIDKHCPDSFEKYQALERLRESIMWANASIACNEKE